MANIPICRPHWERSKQKVPAARAIAGTPMCADCIAGRSFREARLKDRREVQERRSAAMKAAWARPGARARRIAALKKALSNPESRARRSEAMKAAWARPEGLRASQIERRRRERLQKLRADLAALTPQELTALFAEVRP